MYVHTHAPYRQSMHSVCVCMCVHMYVLCTCMCICKFIHAHYQAIGCCWDASAHAVPPCFQMTYRSGPNSSFTISMTQGGAVNVTLRRLRDHPLPSSTPPDAPPPPLTTSEVTLYVEEMPSTADAATANGLPTDYPSATDATTSNGLSTAVRPPELDLDIASPLGDGLVATLGYESQYEMRAGAWRMQVGTLPGGTLEHISVNTSTNTSVFRWTYTPRTSAEAGTWTVCFQGRFFTGCRDKPGSGEPGVPGSSVFQDYRGRNCSAISQMGVCKGAEAYVQGGRTDFVDADDGPGNGAWPGGLRPVDSVGVHCCACGGGDVSTVWTPVKCVDLVVDVDLPPKLLLGTQVRVLVLFVLVCN